MARGDLFNMVDYRQKQSEIPRHFRLLIKAADVGYQPGSCDSGWHVRACTQKQWKLGIAQEATTLDLESATLI
jgi:hypothetical protein